MNKHGAVLEVGEDGDQVAGLLDGGAGGGADGRAHFVGDDVGGAGLAESGRAVQKDVVERLGAAPGGFHEHAELALELGLADKLAQQARAQAELGVVFLGEQFGGDHAVDWHIRTHPAFQATFPGGKEMFTALS